MYINQHFIELMFKLVHSNLLNFNLTIFLTCNLDKFQIQFMIYYLFKKDL